MPTLMPLIPGVRKNGLFASAVNNVIAVLICQMRSLNTLHIKYRLITLDNAVIDAIQIDV